MIEREYRYPDTDEAIEANAWVEIAQERADEMLCCLPPERWEGPAFAVGEPLNHMDDGRAVHDCVVEVDGKFYSKPYPVRNFDPALFVKQVKTQLAAEGSI